MLLGHKYISAWTNNCIVYMPGNWGIHNRMAFFKEKYLNGIYVRLIGHIHFSALTNRKPKLSYIIQVFLSYIPVWEFVLRKKLKKVDMSFVSGTSTSLYVMAYARLLGIYSSLANILRKILKTVYMPGFLGIY